MKLILSKQCESLTGSLGSGYGYAVRKSKKGFYGYRYGHGNVPPDGHLRFILKCAELAQMKLHITDILLSHKELRAALNEAGRQDAVCALRVLNAQAILCLDERWKLAEGLKS